MTALRAEPFGDTQSSLVLSISHATWDIDAVPRQHTMCSAKVPRCVGFSRLTLVSSSGWALTPESKPP